jgi:hypothetical protein
MKLLATTDSGRQGTEALDLAVGRSVRILTIRWRPTVNPSVSRAT